MTKSIFQYGGLVLTILGLMGIISATGPVWARYCTLGLGLVLLLAAFMSRKKD